MRTLSLARRCRTAAVLGVCAAAFAAQAPAAFAADHAVNLTSSDSFSPTAVSVAAGDTVTWHWIGDTHNVTANAGQADTFASGNKSTGTFVKTFTTAGSFTYRCTLHSGMNGTVTVAAGTPGADTTAPGVPSAVIATAAGATVTVDWADSTATDLANYVVERRIGAGAWSTIASPTASTYTDTAVTNGTAYSYRVSAADTTGNTSAASAIVTATPGAPAAGTDHAVNLTSSKTFSPAAVSVATGDSVTWHWTDSRTHNITADSGQADTFASANMSSGTYSRTFNTAGRFTYRCTLHSGMSGSVTVAGSTPPPTPDTTPPSVPSAVLATAADSTVTVDWADSTASDFANYVLERRIGTGAWATIASPTTSVYTDTVVTNGTAYSYRVSAADITGNTSAASAIVTATPAAPPPTTGPATRHVTIANYVFAPAAITIKTGDTVAWDWTGPDLNHSVTSTSGTPSFDSHLGLTDNQITGAPAGGFSRTFSQIGSYTYFCRIHTGMTASINVTAPPTTPDTTPPAAPGATAATAGDASVTVDWADSTAPDFSNYVVQRQTGGGAWTTIGSPVMSMYIDTAVTNGTSYSYRVTAVDMTGNVSNAGAVVAATPVAPPPPPPAAAGPITRHVAIANYQYAPSTMTVNSGDTVEWDWTGSDLNHSVTSLGSTLENLESHVGALVNAILGAPAGGNYSHTFSKVGSYQYFCRVHPDMTGSVNVVASGAPDTQPANPPSSTPALPPAPDVKPARTAKTFNVKVADFAFAPAKLSIALGDVVKWSWTGEDVNHSVTGNAGQIEQFESHPGQKISEVTKAPAGGAFTHVFTHEGTFKYFCRVHPGMVGEVTVGAAPVRVRIVRIKRGSGSLRVSYRLTKPASVKAMVYKAGKRVVTKVTKGKSGDNSVRIVLPRSARKAALKVVLHGGEGAAIAKARASVRAVGR
jgi:plastocyanin